MSGSQLKDFPLHSYRAGGEATTGPTPSPPGSGPPPPNAPPPQEPEEKKWRRWLILFGGASTLVGFLLSFAIHFGVFGYLNYFVLPPERLDSQLELSPRLVSMFALPEEEEDQADEAPPVEEEPEAASEPEVIIPEERVVEEPPPPSNVIDEPPPATDEPPPAQLAGDSAGGGMDLVGMGGTGGVALPQGSGTGRGSGSGTGTGSGERVAAQPRETPSEGRRRERPSAIQLEDTSVAPKPRSQTPSLGYPREFRERGIEGRVVVQCIITERGAVRACRHRSGPEELGEYAISIVRQWTFEPGKDHAGKSVPVAYTFRFPFRLR